MTELGLRLARELAGELTNTDPNAVQLRQAVVQAVGASTVSIRVGGSTTTIPGVACLASYEGRAVNDTVWVLQIGPDPLVIGKAGAGGGPSDPWHEVGTAGEPAFQNAWTNYGDIWETAAFRKDAHGYVHLKGLLKSGTLGAAAFTLPAGYIPTHGVHAGTLSNNAAGGIRVYGTNYPAQAGQVVLGNPGSNAWHSIQIPPFYVG